MRREHMQQTTQACTSWRRILRRVIKTSSERLSYPCFWATLCSKFKKKITLNLFSCLSVRWTADVVLFFARLLSIFLFFPHTYSFKKKKKKKNTACECRYCSVQNLVSFLKNLNLWPLEECQIDCRVPVERMLLCAIFLSNKSPVVILLLSELNLSENMSLVFFSSRTFLTNRACFQALQLSGSETLIFFSFNHSYFCLSLPRIKAYPFGTELPKPICTAAVIDHSRPALAPSSHTCTCMLLCLQRRPAAAETTQVFLISLLRVEGLIQNWSPLLFRSVSRVTLTRGFFFYYPGTFGNLW